jgi:hypothetical protein
MRAGFLAPPGKKTRVVARAAARVVEVVARAVAAGEMAAAAGRVARVVRVVAAAAQLKVFGRAAVAA